MGSLQFVIDSLCSKLTVEAINGMVELGRKQGAGTVASLIPLIQAGDRSLDYDSAKMLAETALGEADKTEG